HDDRVIGHAQAGGRVDPVAVPAGFAQLGEDFVGVVATLAGQDHIEALQLVDAVGILQRSDVLANRRALAADVGGGEEHRLDQVEVTLFQHALHEHGTDHTAPTDQTYTFHNTRTSISSPALAWRGWKDYRLRSASTTASPMAAVPTLVLPSDQMSPVRRPWSSTLLTASSMASAAWVW